MKILLVIFTLLFVGSITSLGCLDDAGKPTQWWFIYQLPGSKAFLYYDKTMSEAGTEEGVWSNQVPEALAKTLTQLPQDKTEAVDWFFYNDQPISEEGKKEIRVSLAHSKGVLAYDDKNIVWMFHTVPAFPEDVDRKSPFTFVANDPIPNSGKKRGQQFVCFSLPFSEQDLKKITETLARQEVFVTHYNNLDPEDKLRRLDEKLNQGFTGVNVEFPSAGIYTLPSIRSPFDCSTTETLDYLRFFTKLYKDNGLKAKNSGKLTKEQDKTSNDFKKMNSAIQRYSNQKPQPFEIDAWSQLAIQEAKQFYVLTFFQGETKQLSPDNNIKTIAVLCASKHCWLPSTDHSKWGISISGVTICVGDNNRSKSQMQRSGLIACFDDQYLYNILNTMIVYVIEKSGDTSSNDFTDDLILVNDAAFKVQHLNGKQLLTTPEDKTIRYSPLWTKDNWNMKSIKHYYGIGQGFMLSGTIPKICETTTGVKIALNPDSVAANRSKRRYGSGAARSGYGAPGASSSSSDSAMDVDRSKKRERSSHDDDAPEAKKYKRTH